MRRRFMPSLAVVLLVVTAAAGAPGVAPPGADWLLDQVRRLSAPSMEGRAAGTPGATRAARHVARVFEDAGLTPAGDAGTFLQSFDVPTGVRLGEANALDLLAPRPRSLALGSDFIPLAVSSDGDETGDVVFAGYGITAPPLGYDDYAGLDARGKIVLVLRGGPREQDPASPFRRPDAYHYSERSHKVVNAREHGARAALLVAHPASGPEMLPRLRGVSQPSGIVAAAITRQAADALVSPGGRPLAALAAQIDGALAPRSLPLGVSARVRVTLVRERSVTANVVGVLPGTDPRLREEAIVVGAHYDHLGHGGEGSLAPDSVAVHPGADDNASGTAAMMGLARAFATAGAPRTLVFVAFGAEEMGLLGSARYVRQPAVPLERTVLMVNLDMVGRLGDGRLYVGGVDSGTGLRAIAGDAARALGLASEMRGDPYAPSDHTSFYAAHCPVLFLFTGAHADYHRPGDTWDKIDARGLERVTAFAARVIAAAAAMPAAPAYVRIEAPAAARPRGGYGPFFGVVPEFGASASEGVRVSGVRPGSPAEKAGVRAGDVLVRFGSVAVKTLEDFTFALRGHRPGDRVTVVIEREGVARTMDAVLEERR
jgi:hypothetical protein